MDRPLAGQLASQAVVIAAGLSLAACSFQPHIEPLQIPTVPRQPFSGTVSPGEAATPPTPDVPSPGEPGFDPDDPLAWIAAIEDMWPNVDVVACGPVESVEGCVPWTAEEAGLLYDTLQEYILSQYLDEPITFVRGEGEEWHGLMIPAGPLINRPARFGSMKAPGMRLLHWAFWILSTSSSGGRGTSKGLWRTSSPTLPCGFILICWSGGSMHRMRLVKI